jgi:hypothetical protein
MLDFKDWKKTKEDSKSVTMKHDKGHEMTLLLKGIPGVQKEALKRLPLYEGGDVGVHKATKEKGGTSEAGEIVRKTKNLNSTTFKKSMQEPAKEEHRSKLEELQSMPKPKLQGLADGGEVDDSDSQPPVTVNVNSGPTPSTAAQQASTPVNVQQPQMPQAPPTLLPNGSMSAPGTAETAQASAAGQAQVDAAKSNAMVQVEQAKLQAQRQQAQQDQDNLNNLKASTDTVASRIKDIDPNHYMENRDTSTKVGQAFGLLLGGMSTGAHGGPNPAMDYINKQIDRDIGAQKQNNENQRTIYGFYKDLYGNENAASALAKASQIDIYNSQAQKIAQQLGTPQAIVNLQKTQSDLAAAKNKAILDAAGNLSSTPNMPRGGGGSAPAHAPQNNTNILRTSTSPEAQNEKPLLPPDDYADSPLLSPNAQGTLKSMQYSSPQDRANYPKALEQFTQAQSADRVLGQLHEVHQKLFQDAQAGGSSGYLRRHDPTATIPFAGHAISQMFVQPATDTQNNRDYDTNKTRIVSDIANALRGTNVSGEAIQRIVDDNTPEHGDTPKMVAQKERNIRVFIKNSVPKSLLSNMMTGK